MINLCKSICNITKKKLLSTAKKISQIYLEACFLAVHMHYHLMATKTGNKIGTSFCCFESSLTTINHRGIS